VSEGLGEFAAHPRIVDPLGGPGWLCGGTAAVAFDPISGDGTGYAIREAILAAAVMRSEAVPADLLAHYRARVVAGFKRHLEACRQFYATGGTGPWWREELARIEDGIRWCGPEPEFRFRLEGFDLKPGAAS
jgi:flavin-dependent dehydrogenase